MNIDPRAVQAADDMFDAAFGTRPGGTSRSPERRDYECGCAWIEQHGNWWHVVACPDHVMDGLPKTEPFMIKRTSASPETSESACGRCGATPATYQGSDPARGLFCRACADRCHEATDFAHICQVCAAPGERYP